MQTKSLQDHIIKVLEDSQASDIAILNVRKLTTVTDLMIMCTGRSQRHLQAIAQHIVEQAKKLKHPPRGIEGKMSSEWVLVDLGNIIVHIMTQEMRTLYDLEKLWESEK